VVEAQELLVIVVREAVALNQHKAHHQYFLLLQLQVVAMEEYTQAAVTEQQAALEVLAAVEFGGKLVVLEHLGKEIVAVLVALAALAAAVEQVALEVLVFLMLVEMAVLV
jgi:hypothetical protein